MKFSAHCAITNAHSQNYPYVESILSFAYFCDEVIVVDGGSTDDSIEHLKKIIQGYEDKIKIFEPPIAPSWPREWVWYQFVVAMNFGLDQCSGDVCIKFDVDYIFHENTVTQFLEFCHAWLDDKEAHPIPPMGLTLHKVNLILHDKSFKKARIPLAINKRDYPELKYGLAFEKDPDFMFAIIPKIFNMGISVGQSILQYPELIKDTPGTIWVEPVGQTLIS